MKMHCVYFNCVSALVVNELFETCRNVILPNAHKRGRRFTSQVQVCSLFTLDLWFCEWTCMFSILLFSLVLTFFPPLFLYLKPLILSCFSILHGTPAFQRVLPFRSPPPFQAERRPSLGEGLPFRGWLLSAGGRVSPIQVSLGYRRGLKSKPHCVLWFQ